MFCIHCPRSLPPGSKFCDKCGKEQTPQVAGSGVAEPAPSRQDLNPTPLGAGRPSAAASAPQTEPDGNRRSSQEATRTLQDPKITTPPTVPSPVPPGAGGSTGRGTTATTSVAPGGTLSQKCPSCGNMYDATAPCCLDCGHTLEPIVAQTQPKRSPYAATKPKRKLLPNYTAVWAGYCPVCKEWHGPKDIPCPGCGSKDGFWVYENPRYFELGARLELRCVECNTHSTCVACPIHPRVPIQGKNLRAHIYAPHGLPEILYALFMILYVFLGVITLSISHFILNPIRAAIFRSIATKEVYEEFYDQSVRENFRRPNADMAIRFELPIVGIEPRP